MIKSIVCKVQDLHCLPPYRNAGCGETEIGNHDLICTGSMSSMLFYRFPPFPVKGHFSACRPSNFFDSAFVHVCVRAVWLSEEGRTWESLVHPPDSGPGPLQAAFALYQNHGNHGIYLDFIAESPIKSKG